MARFVTLLQREQDLKGDMRTSDWAPKRRKWAIFFPFPQGTPATPESQVVIFFFFLKSIYCPLAAAPTLLFVANLGPVLAHIRLSEVRWVRLRGCSSPK